MQFVPRGSYPLLYFSRSFRAYNKILRDCCMCGPIEPHMAGSNVWFTLFAPDLERGVVRHQGTGCGAQYTGHPSPPYHAVALGVPSFEPGGLRWVRFRFSF